MNKDEHLTTQQLLGYSTDRLEGKEENEVGRHLLMCEECRNRRLNSCRGRYSEMVKTNQLKKNLTLSEISS